MKLQNHMQQTFVVVFYEVKYIISDIAAADAS